MMKCPSCGFENKNDARFCTHCGKPLPVRKAGKEELQKLAFDLTASRLQSRKISEQSDHETEVIHACLAWIRTQEPTLFEDEAEDDGTDLPDQMPDLRQLDYEERIVCVLYFEETMTMKEISDLLGIPESKVRGEIQQAFGVSTPADTSAASPEPEEKIPEKPGKKRDWKKIMIFAAAALIALILGVFVGVKRYAASRYDQGVELADQKNYAEAEEAFASALQFSNGGDTEGKLGQMQYLQGNYEEAEEHLAAYHEEDPEDRVTAQYLARIYQKEIDGYLEEKDLGSARDVLEKLYEINQNPIVKLQMEAIDQDGTAEDSKGNVFNFYGRPKTLRSENYRVDLSFDEDGKPEEMSGRIGEGAAKSTYKDFDSDKVYAAEWSPSGRNSVSLLIKEETLNENGDPEEIVFQNRNRKESRKITYTYDDDGRITSARWNNEEGKKTEAEYSWSEDQCEITISTEGEEITHETDTLNEDGQVTESIIEKESADPYESNWEYRRTVYDRDALGSAYHSTVYNEDDEEIGEGWLLKDGSSITLFTK
jgi:YD repeat-containing protein